MDVDLLLVPYDSARRGERMGAGPDALVEAGLSVRIERHGHRVRLREIEPLAGSWRAEVGTAFELAAGIAAGVRDSRAGGRFPLVLAGNCAASWGVCAGLGAGVGVLWADAHADFNTPETTLGGFLDGMALATLTGRCWTTIAARIPGFTPVAEGRVVLLGARDVDPLEAAALDRSQIRRVPAHALDGEAGARIGRGLAGPAPVYLHLDLDVLDPSAGRVNGYAAPNGVSADALADFCGAVRDHAPPSAITLCAYDPAVDRDGRAADAALLTIDALFSAVDRMPFS